MYAAAPHPASVELVLVVGRQQHDDGRSGSARAAGGLDAVDAGQVDVHQHQVGAELGRRGQGLLARWRGADDDEAVGRLDHGGHGATEGLLVVDDQDAHDRARLTSSALIVSRAEVGAGQWG